MSDDDFGIGFAIKALFVIGALIGALVVGVIWLAVSL